MAIEQQHNLDTTQEKTPELKMTENLTPQEKADVVKKSEKVVDDVNDKVAKNVNMIVAEENNEKTFLSEEKKMQYKQEFNELLSQLWNKGTISSNCLSTYSSFMGEIEDMIQNNWINNWIYTNNLKRIGNLLIASTNGSLEKNITITINYEWKLSIDLQRLGDFILDEQHGDIMKNLYTHFKAWAIKSLSSDISESYASSFNDFPFPDLKKDYSVDTRRIVKDVLQNDDKNEKFQIKIGDISISLAECNQKVLDTMKKVSWTKKEWKPQLKWAPFPIEGVELKENHDGDLDISQYIDKTAVEHGTLYKVIKNKNTGKYSIYKTMMVGWTRDQLKELNKNITVDLTKYDNDVIKRFLDNPEGKYWKTLEECTNYYIENVKKARLMPNGFFKS